MNISRCAVALTAVLALTPGAARAQGIAMTPTAGAFIPASDLRGLRDQAEQRRLERQAALGIGLNVEAGMFRGTLAYATGATLTDRGVNGRSDIGDGSVLALAADVVWRPLPRLLVQPYLLGGGGLKRQDYSYTAAGFADVFPRDRTDFTLHFGAGADVMLGGFGIVAEVTDFLSRDGRDRFAQHDAFAMVGLRFRLGRR
jgi:hypothetical protein